jgi:hypothetical protein
MFNDKFPNYSDRRSDYPIDPRTDLSSVGQNRGSIIKRAGPFILVGTSGLSNLAIICDATASIKQNLENNHIPKLFVLDNSTRVEKFWNLMKLLMINSQTLAELKIKLTEKHDDFNDCCDSKASPADYSIFNSIANIIEENKVDDSLGEEKIFEYLKRIIMDATIILGDMQNKTYFEYIVKLNVSDYPIGVFASNVVELLGAQGVYLFQDEIGLDEHQYINMQKMRVEGVITNISCLNPVFSIHLRTSRGKSECEMMQIGGDPKRNFVLAPDCIRVMTKNYENRCYENRLDKTTEILQYPEFVPLVHIPLSVVDEVKTQAVSPPSISHYPNKIDPHVENCGARSRNKCVMM